MAKSDVILPEFEKKDLPSMASGSLADTDKQVSKREMHVQTRELLQTIATLEMYRAQREVANYMELAYLRLADHPDQARDVRMTAHSARTQHIMTAGLMKKFTVTTAHIVNTLIPMTLDAVTELQSGEVVKEIFGQIIEIAEEMKIETESTQKRYLEIQAQIQENMASVSKRNKYVVDQQKKLGFQMEREQQLARAAELAQEELNEEKKRMEEELKLLQSKREQCWENTEKARVESKDSSSGRTFLDTALSPGPALSGGVQGVALNVVSATVNFFTGLFNSDKRSNNVR
ncbi:uncharacterized protein LOC132712689 [Ruditapes philippinarum]|uniref:uncharacterized protein LOC132712689 n=1 Tax=Ruditapes philippinarum TaxID=129788 RepID=UPI00295C026B|nr:uncharacterized protein LOC132712689 [Ruditapes philippinarum]